MSKEKSQQLMVVLDKAIRLLTEARTFREVKGIRDQAEAVRQYARTAALGLEVQNRAAELKLRAERKAGGLLSALHLQADNRKPRGDDGRVTLADLGIGHDQSKRWQKEAGVSEQEFCEFVASNNEAGREITEVGLIRLAQQLAANGLERSGSSHGDHPPSTIREGAEMLAVATADEPETPAWIVAEIRRHRNLLAGLLEPLCRGNEQTLMKGEKKGVEHLLSEMEELLGRLHCLLRGSG